MYTIVIQFKSHRVFFPGFHSLFSARYVAVNHYAKISGAGVIDVVNEQTGEIEFTIDQ